MTHSLSLQNPPLYFPSPSPSSSLACISFTTLFLPLVLPCYRNPTMPISQELPDCIFTNPPALISPRSPTPHHSLYLSNLDDQKFLRFSIKYLYLYQKSTQLEALKSSLSSVLVDYYPLAGRLRVCEQDEEKLEIDCNGEGAVFVETFMDLTVEEFMKISKRPNRSWRKLLYRVDAKSFVDFPPLVIQVTYLSCGGMILCVAINHCLCDGIGTSQFLHAWADLTRKPIADLSITPSFDRRSLKPRNPPKITFSHPQFTETTPPQNFHLSHILQSQPLIPISITFTPNQILHLKRSCSPSLKCTSFEALASHVWRCWVKSVDPPPTVKVKLLFSVNVRKKLTTELPLGFYGNGFVLGCAETPVSSLVSGSIYHGVKMVQAAKEILTDEYVRSMIDFLEENRVKPDLSASLVISQWAKMGLESVDFGEGKPMHVGPLASEIYCIFLPVVGDPEGVTVLMSIPESGADKFEHYMQSLFDMEEEG